MVPPGNECNNTRTFPKVDARNHLLTNIKSFNWYYPPHPPNGKKKVEEEFLLKKSKNHQFSFKSCKRPKCKCSLIQSKTDKSNDNEEEMVLLDFTDSTSTPNSDLPNNDIGSTSNNLNFDDFVLLQFKGKWLEVMYAGKIAEKNQS